MLGLPIAFSCNKKSDNLLNTEKKQNLSEVIKAKYGFEMLKGSDNLFLYQKGNEKIEVQILDKDNFRILKYVDNKAIEMMKVKGSYNQKSEILEITKVDKYLIKNGGIPALNKNNIALVSSSNYNLYGKSNIDAYDNSIFTDTLTLDTNLIDTLVTSQPLEAMVKICQREGREGLTDCYKREVNELCRDFWGCASLTQPGVHYLILALCSC